MEFFLWMKHIPFLVAKRKRLTEEQLEEYSGMFEAMFRNLSNIGL